MRFNIIPVVLAAVFAFMALLFFVLMLGGLITAIVKSSEPTYELVYTDEHRNEWVIDTDLSRKDCSRELGNFLRSWQVEDFKELACEEVK